MNKLLSNEPPPSFVFHCMDGHILDVDIRCCYESELIATLYSLGLVHFFVRLPCHILSLAIKFCIQRYQIFEAYSHDDHIFSDELEQFDARFLRKLPPDVLEQLMKAADLLKIVSLFNMTHYMVFDKLPNESPSWKKKGKSDLTRAGWDEVMKRLTFRSKAHNAKLRYHCMDDKIVNVDPICCYESENVQASLIETEHQENDSIMKKYWGAKAGDIGRFPINAEIPSKILSMVNYFCISHFYLMETYADDDNLFSDMLELFDCCFVRSKPLSILVQLMQAAYEMRIQSLFDLTRNAIVDMLDEKPANKILKIFSLPDFNHKVWRESYLCRAKDWPDKKMMIF